MNRLERRPIAAVQAEVDYGNGEFHVTRPGSFVLCAISGVPIPLEELRYWNVERQEAYATPQAKLKRLARA